MPTPSALRILKKYPNRRLYDTHTSSYITLADVKAMVLQGLRFAVHDAKTGNDLTRSILLQIILEEEAGGMPMFSAPVLAQIIRFYGHAMQGVMGAYFEKNMQMFADLQSGLAVDPGALPAASWPPMAAPYLEQLSQMAAQMQAQMVQQVGAIFPGKKLP
jgi:polyhydroxyalkanoate synthesis repressor PhaR